MKKGISPFSKDTPWKLATTVSHSHTRFPGKLGKVAFILNEWPHAQLNLGFCG